jgi:actin-like ATPase involved in cell morphogenesis
MNAAAQLRGDVPLAIDLGSSRTIVHSPAHRLWLNEPTVVAHDPDGRIVATGRRALSPDVRSTAALHRPVGRGLVVDPSDCVRLLRDVLRRHGLDAFPTIRLSVPANASPVDVAVLSGVVYSVTGSSPETVPALLAGAVGAARDLERPSLICDLGAGLFEAGAVLDGRLVARAAANVGGRDYVANPGGTVRAAAAAVERALRWMPRSMRGALDFQPIHLIGGEARVKGFSDQLAAATGRHVVVHEDAGYAVAAGLARLEPGQPQAAAS